MSRCRIILSRLPEDSWSAFHAKAPATRAERQGVLREAWERAGSTQPPQLPRI